MRELLERRFDRSALDVFDAEPEIRDITLKALGDRETATAEEIMRWMGRADTVLCWLTKLHVSPALLVLLTSVAVNEITDRKYQLVADGVKAWLAEPSNALLADIIRIVRGVNAEPWERAWLSMPVLVIFNSEVWLPKPHRGERLATPDNYSDLQSRAVGAIIKTLSEVQHGS